MKNDANTTGSPKGLPGFLRRTLRQPTEEDRGKSREERKSSEEGEKKTWRPPKTAKAPEEKKKKEKKKKEKKKKEEVAEKEEESAAEGLEERRSYKEVAFENCITAPIVNIRDLSRLSWNGVPNKYRAQAWKILLGYLPANAARRQSTLDRKRHEYRDAILQHYDIDDGTRTLQEQETLRQVLVDVPRTSPDVALFRDNRIRRSMGRLLYIWACRHPASSYVQGINDLVTPLMAVFLSDYYGGKDMTTAEGIDEVEDAVFDEVEADCYWCLTKILAGIQDHYTCDQPGVQRMVMRLEELVQRIDADLCAHFQATGIEFMQFSFKWMNCLLLREFSLHSVMRLWDTYFSEGGKGFEDFHVYVCAAFLVQFNRELKQMEFDQLFGFMQNMPTADWGTTEIEVLLSQAFVLSTLFEGSDAHLNNGVGGGRI